MSTIVVSAGTSLTLSFPRYTTYPLTATLSLACSHMT